MSDKATPAPPSWRDTLQIHPAAEMFPPMSAEELRKLGEDIKANGLASPILLWRSKRSENPVLIDGRNRLDAMELIVGPIRFKSSRDSSRGRDGLYWSLKAEKDGKPFDIERFFSRGLSASEISTGSDPYAIAVSLNLHRRHLTAEKKREVIASLLKADPSKSDRRIAETVKASPTTVGTVRAKMESKGEVSKLDTRTDANGVKQPARKRTKPKPKPEPEPKPKPESKSTDESVEARDRKECTKLFAKVTDAERELAQWRANADRDEATSAPNREALLQSARDAVAIAEKWRSSTIENDAELSAAAEKAAKFWGEISRALGREGFKFVGSIKELVKYERREAKQRRKLYEAMKEKERASEPAVDAMQCALAVERTSPERTDVSGDGLDIPDCLRRDNAD